MKNNYNRQGLYCGYDKNHKEREALDYYASPTCEVENILNIMKLDLKNKKILEPCCGGMHMVQGVMNYVKDDNCIIYARDIKDRGGQIQDKRIVYEYGQDFFADDYAIDDDIDYIIMNPPYSVIEPFTIRALEIPKKGLLMLCRLQTLEEISRYENIFKDNPPTDVYVYINRISCFKNGDFTLNKTSAQAYCWLYFDKENKTKETKIHWIYRSKSY